MLSPSKIAEMAAVKYPTVGLNHGTKATNSCKQLAYIAAFTDAMELMSKEWVPISERLPKEGQITIVSIRQSVLDRTFTFYKKYYDQQDVFVNRDYPFGVRNITHWQLKPEPPVLTKDKKI